MTVAYSPRLLHPPPSPCVSTESKPRRVSLLSMFSDSREPKAKGGEKKALITKTEHRRGSLSVNFRSSLGFSRCCSAGIRLPAHYSQNGRILASRIARRDGEGGGGILADELSRRAPRNAVCGILAEA